MLMQLEKLFIKSKPIGKGKGREMRKNIILFTLMLVGTTLVSGCSLNKNKDVEEAIVLEDINFLDSGLEYEKEIKELEKKYRARLFEQNDYLILSDLYQKEELRKAQRDLLEEGAFLWKDTSMQDILNDIVVSAEEESQEIQELLQLAIAQIENSDNMDDLRTL